MTAPACAACGKEADHILWWRYRRKTYEALVCQRCGSDRNRDTTKRKLMDQARAHRQAQAEGKGAKET